MFVVTDWMAKKMYDLGYLQNLDKSAIPNVEKNLVPILQHPTFDPNRDFSVPWQSGHDRADRQHRPGPRRELDLRPLRPQVQGQGRDAHRDARHGAAGDDAAWGSIPTHATEDDWLAAIDKIKKAVDSGQIRRFTGNDYTRDLANGDAAAVIGWSGDAVQLQADNPDIQFRMPTEGCMFWSDNMVIPVGAPNPTAAEAFMNYVYDPKNQAQITAYNYYVSPVAGVKPILEKTDPAAAKSQLIFPTEQFTKNCVNEPTLDGGGGAAGDAGVRGRLNG